MPFDPQKTSAQSLIRVMEVDQGPFHQWGENELDLMLMHQLNAPLQLGFESFGDLAIRLSAYCAADKAPPNRLSDLLHSPTPSLDLLDLTKQMAKANRGQPDSPLQKIFSVIYYACCVLARTRCHSSITQLTDDALLQGVRWVLAQHWVDAKTRRIFEEGEALLAPR